MNIDALNICFDNIYSSGFIFSFKIFTCENIFCRFYFSCSGILSMRSPKEKKKTRQKYTLTLEIGEPGYDTISNTLTPFREAFNRFKISLSPFICIIIYCIHDKSKV